MAEELAWRLERRPGTPESNLSGELQRSLEGLAFRPLEPILEDFAAAAVRLAERRGVSARFVWSVASGDLDAGSLETFGEIIKQLIRNSLRHGIEGPEERCASGKDETGLLSLKVDRSGRIYRFEYQDDGRGIDQKARHAGMEEESDLLETLGRPGFSTADEIDVDGGRGLGLNMIRHMVRREFGSDLELENRPGAGLIVRWSLPEKHMRRPYRVFFADGRQWAVPAGSVHRWGAVDPSRVDAAGQGYHLGDGVAPIVGPEGLRSPGSILPYFLEIRHRGRRAALFVDDLISEEPWGSDELCPADPIGIWGRALRNAKSGIPILSPALVYAGEETTGALQNS